MSGKLFIRNDKAIDIEMLSSIASKGIGQSTQDFLVNLNVDGDNSRQTEMVPHPASASESWVIEMGRRGRIRSGIVVDSASLDL